MIAQRPKQGRIGVYVTDVGRFTIDGHVKWHSVLLADRPTLGRQVLGKAGVNRPAVLRRSRAARDVCP